MDDAFHHEHTLGNRAGETFTTHAIDNIVKEMQSKVLDKCFYEVESSQLNEKY